MSTHDQNEARQLDGFELDKIFTDRCSAGTRERPGLNQLLEYARAGDTVFIHSLDRLGRSVEIVKKILDELLSKNVKVHFLKENLLIDENSNHFTNFIIQMLSSFAEFERNIIKERQAEGIRIAKLNKKYCGKKPVISPEMAENINFMVSCGKKVTEICRHYKISRSSFYKYAAKKLPKRYIPKFEVTDAPADNLQQPEK